jgi:uncharacterized protein (DUF1330 family)
MGVYVAAFIISTVLIHDKEKFGEYVKTAEGAAGEFGGSYVVRGPVTHILDGISPLDECVVVLQFPDEVCAKAFYTSERYQQARRHGLGAADVSMRLITAL